MKDYVINNEFLQVCISAKGAEMQSIKTLDKTEYLWQGDPEIWGDKAINIFPYVARLTAGKYRYNGKTYKLQPHGFLCHSELQAEEQTADSITLILVSDENIKKCYPFTFKYSITYRLVKNTIQIIMKVENRDDKTMYFGLGGHPGFIVPIGEKGLFEDCYLEFSEECTPYRVGMSETCFVNGEDKPFPLRDNRYIDLSHDLFDLDAIILYSMSKKVSLKSKKTNRSVSVEYPDMRYLGIWHKPGTDAKYICIEPWSSLPSREGIVEDIADQDNLLSICAGEDYVNQWSIEIV